MFAEVNRERFMEGSLKDGLVAGLYIREHLGYRYTGGDGD